MVTRENGADRRYGLGKSLAPIIEGLEFRGVVTGYLSQEDLGPRGVRWLRVGHGVFSRLFGPLFGQTDIRSLSWGVLERLNMGRLAAAVARRHGFTHVHCHDPIITAGYRWFARLRRLGGVRYGVTEHGFGSYAQSFHEDGAVLGSWAMRRLRAWERRILAKADWVLMPAHCGASQVARDLGEASLPAHWKVIPHSRPTLSRYSRDDARSRLGWLPGRIHLIAVGRLAPLKCLPSLVRGCARLEGSDWRLTIVGEGDRTPLRTLAESLGVEDRIDYAVTDDVGLYYSAADIYVSTSSTESFGLANLEALCFGLPSVCTAAGCTPEVLGSGAWLIPPKNLPALVSALQALLDDAELRHSWARRAVAWTANWPSSADIADAYLALYRGEPVVFPEREIEPLPGRLSLATWQAEAADWPVCTLPPCLPIPEAGSVLLLAPHSDDETLGCGGLLALLRQAGWRVKVVVMTDGALGDPMGYLDGADVVTCRQQETRAALRALDVVDVDFLDAPDGSFIPDPRISARLCEVLDGFKPDWLLAPPVLDFHRDHLSTSRLALELWHTRGYRERLFLYEIWQPLPVNWVIDVTLVMESKRRAVAAYRLPLMYQDYSGAFEGMMRYRALYLGPHSGTHAEGLLELKPDSWQAVVSSLIRLRVNQERDFGSPGFD